MVALLQSERLVRKSSSRMLTRLICWGVFVLFFKFVGIFMLVFRLCDNLELYLFVNL